MGSRERPADRLKRLEAMLRSGPPRSFPAYVRAEFDRLSRILDAAGRDADKWHDLAEWAVAEGLTGTDGAGKPRVLTAAAVKRAYEREAKRRRGLGEVAKPSVPPPAPAPSAVSPSGPDARARLRSQLKPVTIRKER